MTDPFVWMEPVSLAVVLFWLAIRFRRGRAAGGALARDFALLAVAAWAAEDTAIRLYGFYGYADGWTLRLDRVPVMVAAIWPVVILSAGDIARRLVPGRPGAAALAGAGIVLLDATLIECVATSSGLWAWHEPGPFGVPLMGIFGWSCFALAALWARESLHGAWRLALPPVVVAATHALLLASWWGFFRWITGPIPEGAFAAGVAVLCAVLTVGALRVRRRAAIPFDEMLARIVAAGVFFALLGILHRDRVALLALAGAFVPPWTALTVLPGNPPKGEGDRAETPPIPATSRPRSEGRSRGPTG